MIIPLPAENPHSRPFDAYKAPTATGNFGQQTESAKRDEPEPGFEKVLKFPENPINSMGHIKILGYFGQE